jgi:putative membrane protein
MKKLSVCLIMLLATWSIQSCSNEANKEDSVEVAKEQNEDIKSVEEDDSKFLVKAASGGMMEVELGQLAQQKAASQAVKDFGAMMVRDHTQANNDLKALAANKNIAIPVTMGEDHMKHVNDLREKAGAEFDKDYMSMMVDDHQEDINDFEKASNNAKDADIKAFAAKVLPTLRTHLDAAKSTNEAIRK